jgi:hypothetical protein
LAPGLAEQLLDHPRQREYIYPVLNRAWRESGQKCTPAAERPDFAA